MKKKIFLRAGAAAVFALLILTLSSCSIMLPFFAIIGVVEGAQTTDDVGEGGNDRLLFWEVTHPDHEGKLYLLGSIHVADESIYPLGDKVMEAYENADCIAVELDILKMESDLSLMTELSQMMIYPNNGMIKEHMPQDLYKKAKDFLKENNSFVFTFDYMKPMVWSSVVDEILVSYSGLSADYGVDRYFTRLAKDDEKEIIELETAVFQYQLTMSVPDELAFFFIEQNIDGQDYASEQYLEMYEKWKIGDVEWFEEYIYSTEDVPEDLIPLLADYYEALLDRRNHGMADKAMDILKSGKDCFYVVGAAHMIGPEGLVSLLSEAGCTVKRVDASPVYLSARAYALAVK